MEQFIRRTEALHRIIMLVLAIFVIRLFDVQVIHYHGYAQKAFAQQFEATQIPAERGLIEAQQGDSIVPIVLNQKLYTLYGDPSLIKNPGKTSSSIAQIIGGNPATYARQLQAKGTQYVVLARKISPQASQKILSYHYPGIGTQGQDYRIYPNGDLAAQVLGFVGTDGQGQYGVEQALNKTLSGTPGELKAYTAANGVPLVAEPGNIEKQPNPGDNVVLTINTAMQSQMQQILQSKYKSTNSQGLSAIIMNPNNGQIDAMANYPSYDPANYQSVSDPTLFENAAIDNAIEPGSSMKTLTTSAALDSGAITPNESFFDPAHWVVDGFNITDIEQDGGARQQNIASILALSLNTGATWMLMQMSNPGSTTINQKGIETWHSYMAKRFRLGQPTGIEQGYEDTGYIPLADMSNPSISLTYADSSFGQGVTLTALQLGAALSSVLNGGTYYQPTLVAGTIAPSGKTTANLPRVLEHNVVSPKVGQELIPLMQNVVTTYFHEGYSFMNFPNNYLVGGKTGTAQVANPSGGYYSNIFNGTYIGFVGNNKPQYLIVVFNIKPNVPGYAGALGGQPVFADLAHMLINDGYVTPN
ncbi:MAG TPA: penicillin-binding protein 2 [Candidatus Saccharimonadales bacterium]|nr:penicillin-binding protein 2 [Candidatus Saccharimonadales bacterium]